jgi:hypothetical protein
VPRAGWVAASAYESEGEGVFYMSAYLAGPDATVRCGRQRFLDASAGRYEQMFWSPGHEPLAAAELPGVRVVNLVGADLRAAAVWSEAAALGARCVVGGASEPSDGWARTCRVAAGMACAHGIGSLTSTAPTTASPAEARRSPRTGPRSPPAPTVSITSEDSSGLGSIPHAYYARTEPLTGVVLLPDQHRHDPGEHPENVRRLPPVVEHLRASPEWDKLIVLYPRYARVQDALRSHTAGFVEVLEASAADAPVWLDTDTRVSPQSFDACLLSTGFDERLAQVVAAQSRFWAGL